MAVVPPDAVTLVRQLTQDLENLTDSLRFTDVMTRDHDGVASFGCVFGSVHGILLCSEQDEHAAQVRRGHRGNY
jgi:hypothetical protein